MMKKILLLGLGFLLTFSMTSAAREAFEEEGEGSRSMLSNVILHNTSFLYGPVVSDPASRMGDSSWVGRPAAMSLQNQLGLRYEFDDTFALTPTLDFEVVMNDPNEIYKEGQVLSLTYDSFIKASAVGLLERQIAGHDFWVNTDVRVFVPSSEYSRAHGTLGGVRFTLAPYIQFAHSSFSLSFVNFVRFWAQTRRTETNDSSQSLPRTMFYTGPLVNYQLTDSLALWALLEASITYDTFGVPNTRDPRRSLVDLEPGIDIRINDHVTVSPYINWFTNQELNTASMNLMATITM